MVTGWDNAKPSVSRVAAAAPQAVYEYASDIRSLPRWAAGLHLGHQHVAGP